MNRLRYGKDAYGGRDEAEWAFLYVPTEKVLTLRPR